MKNKFKVLFILLLCLSSCGDKYKSFPVSDMIKDANDFINEYLSTVDNSRKGNYHLSSPIGWLNDPNGFTEFHSTYHLFYQFNPYTPIWGPMHWGHQTTKDFIKWTLEDVALAPDERYDEELGCFSGTGLVDEKKLYVAYTSVTDKQTQSIAYSYDGVTFEKSSNNPIISEQEMPSEFSIEAFRDPKLFKRNGKYYIICGNELKDKSQKQLILFESQSLEAGWKYVSTLYSRNDVGGLFECPDLVEFDDKDVLMTSPQSMFNDNPYELQNVDSCIYLVGNLSTNSYKFYKTGDFEEFDKGFSFYAPQTMKTSDGRTILVAWMKSWAEPNITEPDGWAGSMTLPRELELIDNHIYQRPAREIENYYSNSITRNELTLENDTYEFLEDDCFELEFSINVDGVDGDNETGVEIFKGSTYSTKIYYDSNIKCVVLDRSNCGSSLTGKRYAKVEPINGKIKIQLFADKSSVEVFINDGYYTQTANIFPNQNDKKIEFFSKGCMINIEDISYNHILIK